MSGNSTNGFKSSESRVLDGINTMSSQANTLKDKCNSFRSLLDEGSYKIDALLNIVDNLKRKEQAVVEAGGDEAVMQQITEEQIDSFLEILKTPAFQSLIKQMLHKWAT